MHKYVFCKREELFLQDLARKTQVDLCKEGYELNFCKGHNKFIEIQAN